MIKILMALAAANLVATLITLKQNKKIMAKQETFDALVTRLKAATDEIAADLKKLREELANAPKDTVSDESLANLDTNITALEEMGKDPADPLPTEEPV